MNQLSIPAFCFLHTHIAEMEESKTEKGQEFKPYFNKDKKPHIRRNEMIKWEGHKMLLKNMWGSPHAILANNIEKL